MKKLSLLAIFLVVSCSSIPKTTIPNHNIQLTCEVGSRYYFINLQDVPKRPLLLVSDNAWYISSLITMPDFNQKPSIWGGFQEENQKYFLSKPYSVTNDVLYFTTYSHKWEVNKMNMKATLVDTLGRYVMGGTCEYGFQTEQFK